MRPSVFRAIRAGLKPLWFVVCLAPGFGQPAEPTSSESVVVLPPLTVSDGGTPLQWRYLELPGLEILSVCDESTAIEFAQRLRRLDDLLAFILPPRFTAKMSVPEMMILLDQKTGQARSKEVLVEMQSKGAGRVRFLPNLRVIDFDATAVFAIVQPNTSAAFTYASERIAFLLERRVPHLPGWFIEGMLGFYQQLELRDRAIEIRPVKWLSALESAAIKLDPDRPRTLLPLEEMFSGQRVRNDLPGELDDIWRAQCTLFVRWALVHEDGAHREALWNFVEDCGKKAPDEDSFRKHFGLGYADARDRLSDYLSDDAHDIMALPVPPTPRLRLRFREATDLEIARIRGDWERMEIGYVRAKAPTYADKYIEQARRTLTRAHEKGERDPRLFALLGLTEIDAGNAHGAKPYLEYAVQNSVVRPRAYYELARLRFEEFTTENGPEKKFTAAQTTEIMAPLLAVRRQEPPLPQVYALLINTLAHSEAPPTAEQLAVLHQGALKFPKITDLVLRVIYLHAVNGQPNAAASLVELGLNHTSNPQHRARFQLIKTELSQLLK